MTSAIAIQLPECPTLLKVLSVAPDGRETDRGTLMAGAAQALCLVSPMPNWLQRQTQRDVANALKLGGAPLRFIAISDTPVTFAS